MLYMKNELIKRLSKLMERREITAAELSRRSGIRASSISDYLNGKYEPKQDKIDKLARALNVTPAWLMGYGRISDNLPLQAVKIPILGRVVAGVPMEAIENIEGYEDLTPSMIGRGEFFALRIKGKSMEPVMQDGDLVIVRRQNDIDNGDIAIVSINGDEATCKKVHFRPDGITLVGFNVSEYEPHFYSIKQVQELPLTIIGKVVELRRSF